METITSRYRSANTIDTPTRDGGYSDRNFDENVIPNDICPKCGKSRSGETAEEQEKRLGNTYKIYKSFL